MLHPLSCGTDESRVFLSSAVADAVLLGSGASRFFIAFLFLSSLGVSRFGTEESVPRGPCGVTVCV